MAAGAPEKPSSPESSEFSHGGGWALLCKAGFEEILQSELAQRFAAESGLAEQALHPAPTVWRGGVFFPGNSEGSTEGNSERNKRGTQKATRLQMPRRKGLPRRR